MKNFTIGRIFCKCSVRMRCKGLIVQVYENTLKKKKCPNCRRGILFLAE